MESSNELTEVELNDLLIVAAATADALFADPIRMAELRRKTEQVLEEVYERQREEDRKTAVFLNQPHIRALTYNCIVPIC